MTSSASNNKPVIITFLDADDQNQYEVTRKLQEEGFKPRQPLGRGRATSPAEVPFAGILAFKNFDENRIDKALQATRDHLSENRGNPDHIICCCESLLPRDAAQLRNWGAAKVVQPESWDARAVADRILAALFGGFNKLTHGVEAHNGEKPYMECWVPFKAKRAKRRIIGATRVMRELFGDIEFYSSLRDPILIRGETGTGKELVAAAIHSPNVYSNARYITINIAEISSDLLPNELFGHCPEAFTDARTPRPGLLAEAGDGTVFIDEIGDLDKENQARLLRVFSNLEIRPVGATHEIRVALEARLIFATHQPLEAKCANNLFRHDLYRRITEGHTIWLPPLRERKGDIELLAKEFYNEWRLEREEREDIFALLQVDYDNIVDLCVSDEFPGNVRALRGALRGCFSRSLKARKFDIANLEREITTDRELRQKTVATDGGVMTSASIRSISFDPEIDTLKEVLTKTRTVYFKEVYRAAGGRSDVAIKVADVGKKTFYEYCKDEQRREVLKSIKNKKTRKEAT